MEQVKVLIKGGSCLCTFYYNGKADVMIIDSVWVDEGRRGKGIGEKVVAKAVDLAKQKGVDAIELVVSKDNHIAKKLYRKFDFRKTDKEHQCLIIRDWNKNG